MYVNIWRVNDNINCFHDSEKYCNLQKYINSWRNNDFLAAKLGLLFLFSS